MEEIPTIQLVKDLKRIGMKHATGAKSRVLEFLGGLIEKELQRRADLAMKVVAV